MSESSRITQPSIDEPHINMVSPHIEATCPVCGAYVLDKALHDAWHECEVAR